jgi:hypothetical protein
MSYYSVLVFFFGGFGAFVLALYFFLQIRKDEKLQKLLTQPFKEVDRNYLKQTPHYRNLSKEEKEKIERSIILFSGTKEFIGVSLEITDEMKVIIAFYACLLLLHKTSTNCYDNVKTIIVYPNAVAFENIQASNGIYSKEKFLIDGQATIDTVIIIWNDAKKEAYHLRHNNVIVHEFTHEIDFMDGEVDGVPPIEQSKYDAWTKEFYSDYKKLNEVLLKDREWGKYKLLGSYAATNEAEFFAVVTERFFESPRSLKKHFPELYYELKEFFELDTVKLIK